MTTIVVHNNTIYGDGQMTGDFISSTNTKKILNLGNVIVAGAGRWAHVKKFHEWVSETILAEEVQDANPFVSVKMPEKMVADDFTGVVLYPDGVVIKFEGCDNSFEIEQPVFLGTGGEIAAGCLFGCQDGYKAVEAAIALDPYSGGEIQVETFEEPEEEITREDLEGMSKEDIINKIFGEETVPTECETSCAPIPVKVLVKTNLNNFENCIIFNNGFIETCGRTFESFSEMDAYLKYYKEVADDLGVKYVHNISAPNLAKRLDEKVKEMIDNL